jgi:hypothetical protein
MMASGFGAILVMALLSSGSTNTDLVALIQPKHYFQTREVAVSIDKMMELATSDPKDSKTQVMQLTALRYLTDETEALKRDANFAAHRQVLEQIAKGKKANDSLGFAADYAGRLLAKLNGTKVAHAKAPLLREDALDWFTADANLLMAVDMRQSREAGKADPIGELLKMVPEQEKKQMYEFIEKAGNIRLERYSFAMVSHTDHAQMKVMVRLTGKANPAWVAALIRSLEPNFETTELKDAKETPIVVLQNPGRGVPAIALVGNTDLLVVGYARSGVRDGDLLKDVLAVREKKQPSAVKGALKDLLAKVPDKAVALLVGDVPDELKREFGPILDPVPAKLFAYVERDPQGLDVRFETTMASAEEADKLVTKVGALRKEGIKSLQDLQGNPPPGAPPIPFASLINLMESLQVQNKTATVQMRLLVPDGLLQELGTMSGALFGMRMKLE